MLTVIIAVLGFILDRVAKIFAKVVVEPAGSIVVIKNFFSFTYVENRGAAHGILQGGRWPLSIITIIVCTAIIIFLVKKYSKMPTLLRVSAGLILAGGIGNLVDRLFLGYVIDMMEITFIEYPVFNPADNMLVIGTILLGLYILFFDKGLFFGEKKTQTDSEKDNNGDK